MFRILDKFYLLISGTEEELNIFLYVSYGHTIQEANLETLLLFCVV